MRYRVCPQALRKYGFCGVLALLYACNLPMPSTERAFDATLDDMSAILGEKKRRQWQRERQRGKHKRRGSITLSETLAVLAHHHARCSHCVQPTARQSVRRWLQTAATANTRYILHTNAHALFVDVGRSKSAWRIYDQAGRRTRADLAALTRKGGHLCRKVVNVIAIGAPAAPAAPAADTASDDEDDVPLQLLSAFRGGP